MPGDASSSENGLEQTLTEFLERKKVLQELKQHRLQLATALPKEAVPMSSKDTLAAAPVFCHQFHREPYIQNI